MKVEMEKRKNATAFAAASNILFGVGLLLMLFGATATMIVYQVVYLVGAIVVYIMGSQFQLEAMKVAIAPEKK